MFCLARLCCDLERLHYLCIPSSVCFSLCTYLLCCCLRNVGTLYGSLLMSFGSLFSKILNFHPIEKFALRCKHNNRVVIGIGGCLLPADMTTRHKSRKYFLLFLTTLNI